MTTTTSPPFYGTVRPRVATPPAPADSSLLVDVMLGVLTLVGHDPMPWQVHATEVTMGQNGGAWAQPEAAVIVARQNGKTDLLGARILTGTRFLGERVLYTTHSLQASTDLWRRVTDWVDNTPTFRRKVRSITRSNGRERMAMLGGGVLQIATSKGKPPRGFDQVGLLVFDEARELLSHGPVEAMTPTQTAARNPQRWYLSNAGSLASVVLNPLRDRGRAAALAGITPRQAWLEWSAPAGAELDDVAALAAANPALGHTITLEYLLAQRPPQMTEAGYRTEHLCQWVASLDSVISAQAWDRLRAADTIKPPPGCSLAFDVDLDRGWSAIAAAWAEPDGRRRLALIEHRPTAGWLADRVEALWRELGTAPPAWDPHGPAGDVADALARRDVPLHRLSTEDVTASASALVQLVADRKLTHQPSPPLDTAVAIAGQRPIGDRWTWRRRTMTGSIAPLTAGTFALWAWDHQAPAPVAPQVFDG